MSPVLPPAKALVTGANGYIGAWVVRTLLEKGYDVRGTVRSESKGVHLRSLFAGFGDRFELIVVPDITAEGAFDEAVKGIDLVEHTASPFHFNIQTPDDLIVPAVQGTTSILNSILKNGQAVKRVVLTASTASVQKPGQTPANGKWDESSWNEPAVREIEEKGAAASKVAAYQASKTLAERAAWAFVKEHAASIQWDLAVLNPPFVFGPPIHEVESAAKLNTSMLDLFNNVVRGAKTDAELASSSASMVDVRDLALAHVLAAQKAAAGGERTIISAAPYYWQDILDLANSSATPEVAAKLHKGQPGATKDKPFAAAYDNSKCARILEIPFRTLEETVRDSVADFKAKGWL
ncbi:D-lactaldehyde dehydrogenase [Dentipellis sp. KUC8613]|nr:D-lactaldehyde dehydrogenase [Dentipellis sp. KUC8613]